ncbi:MAG: phosphopyruvate hydratase [bacterium]
MKIKKITARQIIDSRGVPTIEVTAYTSSTSAKFSVPSGASVGSFEALELRDNNPHDFFGKSVKKAVNNVNNDINKLLTGKNPLYQKDIDELLIDYDNTDNKSHMGANAILGTSVAIAKLVAAEEGIPAFKYIRALYDPYINFTLGSHYKMPIPMFNMVNGGAHADNDIASQEFMVIPAKTRSMHNRIKIAAEINHELKILLEQGSDNTAIGDEGGYAALDSNDNKGSILTDTESILKTLSLACKKAGYTPGEDIFYGLDLAATRYFQDNSHAKYVIPNWTKLGDFEGNFDYLLDTYQTLVEKFPILLMEDLASENDWPSWVKLKKQLGKDIYIVGDDLTVTNPKRLQKAVLLNCINAIIIKPNQIGSLTEVFETASKAHENGIESIVSHRSGETTDDFIADLAVGIGAKFYKGGNIMRGERVAKYNRFLEIEELLA